MPGCEPMKARAYRAGLSVQAIAGTHVVLFGFDVPSDRVADLMGFSIKKKEKGAQGEGEYLPNFLLFKLNDKGRNSDHSSYENPFQEFVWGDYTLSPEREYRYEVTARYGKPGALRDGASVRLDVKTESESDGVHAVFFNRGVAGSQRYAVKFHNKKPKDAGPEAYAWLSRGLAEAMAALVASHRPGKSCRT